MCPLLSVLWVSCLASELTALRLNLVRTEAPSPETTAAPTPAPTTTPIVTCDDITDISVRGQNWTNVVKTVCNIWPKEQFGKFPAGTVQQLTTILQRVFDEGGLWDQLKSVVKDRTGRYCLRQEVTRLEMVSAASALEKTCPETLSDDVLEEMPEEVENHKELAEGYWACQESESNSSRTPCECRQRFYFENQEFPVVNIASRPRGCKMVHRGKCYGSCPRGYRPTFLKGWFRPVCESVCAETNFPVTCGVGCANTRGDCVNIILNQVKEVTIAASKVASFFMSGAAGLALHAVVEQVVKIAEFAFNVLSKVLQVADAAFTNFKREEAELATVVSLFQVLKEMAADVAKDWLAFRGLIRDSGKLFIQLIDANFGWKNINLGWISSVVMQNGILSLTGAFEVAKAFAYDKCQLATDEVAFTMESVGDQRLLGAWSQDGSTNGKPRYRLIRDRANTVLEWSRRGKTWSVFYLDQSFGRGWWFGWLGMGWRELYYTKSDTPNFPTSGWRKTEGALPLPELVSATNGGE